MNEHHDFAYIYTCYDPKNRDALIEYADKRFGKGNYFFDCDPGAGLNIANPRKEGDKDFVIFKMQLATEVHPYTRLLIINHSACGAYAKRGFTYTAAADEEARHKEDMEKIKGVLAGMLQGIEIETHYFLKDQQKMAW
jgi:hypothetical protein